MEDDIYKRFICLDCNVNTSDLNEYYMVHDHIWNSFDLTPEVTKTVYFVDKKRYGKITIKNEGMLCIGCLETRLGRQLNKNDFTHCPINMDHTMNTKSERLLDRLQRNG